MSTIWRTTAAVAAAGLLAATAVEQADAAVRGRAFDGQWSVLINTAYGNCGNYRAAIDIVGGRVVSPSQDYTASGYVNANGATSVMVRSSAGSATGYGRLRDSTGAGRWRSSSGECAGTWTAFRRGYY